MSYQVEPYTFAKLESLFIDAASDDANPKQIKLKQQLRFFRGYFSNLETKTIVVESDYTDKYYTEDYSEYYVRCFTTYARTCTRLHFFSNEFTKEDFSNLLQGDDSVISSKLLKDSYQGFVVLKPLPQTIIGRTCLQTYSSDENRRNYSITRSYDVSLFGINLKIDNTLAFQEQDSVVAACATSALWSVFHGTGKLFQHQILSPARITKIATKHVPVSYRTFPHEEGLTSEMMAHAIRAVGLEPSLVRMPNYFWLKNTLYAYLRAGIPIIFGIDLLKEVTTEKGKSFNFFGKHAIAVTGYSLDDNADYVPSAEDNAKQGDFPINLRASKIDKIYCHDDGIGPFARMELDNAIVSCNDKPAVKGTIGTEWKRTAENNKIVSVRARPDILLIPLYHKIRIPFATIVDSVASFNAILGAFIETGAEELEWDIFLSNVNDFKRSVFDSDRVNLIGREDILTSGAPKFVWRAIARKDNNILIELLFDATDLSQGKIFIRAIEHNEAFSESFRKRLSSVGISQIDDLGNNCCRSILKWFFNL